MTATTTTASVIETMSSSSFSNSNTSLGYASEPSIANNKIELSNGKTMNLFIYIKFLFFAFQEIRVEVTLIKYFELEI